MLRTGINGDKTRANVDIPSCSLSSLVSTNFYAATPRGVANILRIIGAVCAKGFALIFSAFLLISGKGGLGRIQCVSR